MEALTARQQQILEFVRLFHEKHGYAPTRQDIATAFEFSSVNAAEQHLKALAAKGALRLVPGISRGIVLPPPAEKSQPRRRNTG